MTYIIIIIIALFCPSLSAEAQNIETKFTIGNFNNASSISINPTGFIYVADIAENEIYKLDTLGNLINTIGGYGWDNYSFDEPVDVFATTLNVYVSDKNNNRIKIYDKDLNFLSDFNTGLIEDQDFTFGYPTCSAISNQGDLYILDSDNMRILKYNLRGKLLQEIGSYEAGDFMLSDPLSFIVAPNNNLFVADGDQVIIFDQFGMGLNKINLDFTPKNININFSSLVISGLKRVKFIDLSQNSLAIKSMITLDDTFDEIVDAVVFNQKTYVLFKNSILVYKNKNNPVK